MRKSVIVTAAPNIALVTGALGQDGFILCQKLRSQHVQVVAVARPGAGQTTRRQKLATELGCRVVDLDLTQPKRLGELVEATKPNRIFHLAAVHHSSSGTTPTPSYWGSMTAVNFNSLHEALTAAACSGVECRIVYASSSQIWTPNRVNQAVTEGTPVNPTTFYGHTKVWGTDLLCEFRKQFGLHASVAILFNHESPHRGPSFVTRKITMAAARAARGEIQSLHLGNIGATVDWHWADDAVTGLLKMAEAAVPDDFIFASRAGRTIKDFLSVAYGYVGLDWRNVVVADRDEPAPSLVGVPDKAVDRLGWQPSLTFEELVKNMVDSDLQRLAAA